jgi:sugar transferase (PEP-CTERM/EpsH1 system associated)
VNILFLTHRVPFPPNRGDRIRSYHLLQFLARRANVSLACVSDESAGRETLAHLQSLCDQVAVRRTTKFGRTLRAIWSLARGRSATEGHFWHSELARTISQWSGGRVFDAVVSYCSGMYRYTLASDLINVPTLVDLVDVDSQKWREYADRSCWPMSWLYGLEARRVAQLERELGQRCEAVTVVSDAEAELLRELRPQAVVHSVPNGVDVDYFAPDDETLAPAPRLECVFVGVLDYFANVEGVTWFCRSVWPDVVARFPQARFVIVGRRPVAQIRGLASQPGVEVVGEVADVRPYLRKARVVVVPLRIARGIQNKVLEAMSAGIPVVASPQAIEGLDVVPHEHVYVADTPADWVSAIGSLFGDEGACRRLGAAGRAFVCQHHLWDDCLRPLEDIFHLTKRELAPALSGTNI